MVTPAKVRSGVPGRVAAFLFVIFTAAGIADPSRAGTVSTSFEFSETAPFTVGESPLSANFSAGVAESRGVPEFYKSGNAAWHIPGGETATVSFETPPRALNFWARTETAGGDGRVRVFDETDTEIFAETLSDSFENLVINRPSGESLIGRLEIVNAGTEDLIIDDLSFTAFDPNANPMTWSSFLLPNPPAMNTEQPEEEPEMEETEEEEEPEQSTPPPPTGGGGYGVRY